MSELDTEFIRRAERITSFNLETKDFETLCYKREIQALITKHFFPNFDLRKTIDNIDIDKLNKLIDNLRSENIEMLGRLLQYNLKGAGPGEVLLFYLVNKAYLGGGSSAGVDIVVVDEKCYEMKAVQVSQQRIANDFRLGGTVPLYDIMQNLNSLRSKHKLDGSDTEIKKSVIETLRENHYSDFKYVEEQFKEVAHRYFDGHEVIFVNNSKTPSKFGKIEAVKKVTFDDILIERVSSGTIKPAVIL